MEVLSGPPPTRSFSADPRQCDLYATGLKESARPVFQFLSKETAGREKKSLQN